MVKRIESDSCLQVGSDSCLQFDFNSGGIIWLIMAAGQGLRAIR